jgi:hypothetical protein
MTTYIIYKDKEIKEGYKTLYGLDLKDDDLIIAYDYLTPLEVRYRFPNIPYDALVVIASRSDKIEDIEKDKRKYYDEDYAIFSGAKIKCKERENKIEILRAIKLLSNVMFQMIDAGYMNLENNKKIDDWIPSFEHPLLKIFILYHGFETSNESLSIEDEFMINPWFRKNILFAMMKIISNFILNNKLITREEVKEIGLWTEEKTWLELKNKVKIF